MFLKNLNNWCVPFCYQGPKWNCLYL